MEVNMDKENKNMTFNLFYDEETNLQSLIDEYLLTLYLKSEEINI